MRGIKELLELMLSQKQLYRSGLCKWVQDMYDKDIISWEESDVLFLYIQANRPSAFSSISAFKRRNFTFYWESGDIKPRIKWLEKHIKKLNPKKYGKIN